MAEVNEDDFLKFTLDRKMLEKLYLVLIAGAKQYPENLDVVMWLSNPIKEDLPPSEVYEDAYFLKLHKYVVDDLVKYAQSTQLEGNWEGPQLSATVRRNLVPGTMRHRY